jgi:hypothetical protein
MRGLYSLSSQRRLLEGTVLLYPVGSRYNYIIAKTSKGAKVQPIKIQDVKTKEDIRYNLECLREDIKNDAAGMGIVNVNQLFGNMLANLYIVCGYLDWMLEHS